MSRALADVFDKPIKQRTFIAVPLEKVFGAITSAAAWDSWFTTDMVLEPKENGQVVFRWKDWGPDSVSTEVRGRVIEISPHQRFVFEWGTKMPTQVSLELSEKQGGTIIELNETGYPRTSNGLFNMLDCACGWGEALVLLKFYLEHGLTYSGPKTAE